MTLTQRDLNEIEKIVDQRVDDKISHLPTKDDFYQKMDELIGELKGMREDFAVISGKLYEDHEPRIVRVEKKLRIQPSA
jgi:hypothetical protein